LVDADGLGAALGRARGVEVEPARLGSLGRLKGRCASRSWWDSTDAPQEPDTYRKALERLLRDLKVRAS
jgi:hypothetical protein